MGFFAGISVLRFFFFLLFLTFWFLPIGEIYFFGASTFFLYASVSLSFFFSLQGHS